MKKVRIRITHRGKNYDLYYEFKWVKDILAKVLGGFLGLLFLLVMIFMWWRWLFGG